MTKIETAVCKTLLYSDMFDFPLTEEELQHRLIGVRVTPPTLHKTLETLVTENRVGKSQGYFHMPGRIRLVQKRTERMKIALSKYYKATRLAHTLKLLPSIQGIFVTGTLAVGNTEKDDDIDLMIVTANNALWTTRLIITPILDAIGARRRPQVRSAPDLFCLNIYLSPHAFKLPKSEQNLYTAYELTQMQPLVNKNNAYEALLASNAWLTSYLPNTTISKVKASKKKTWNPLETIAFALQKNYMKGKTTNERVERDAAFFHPRPLAPILLEKFADTCKNYGLEP